MCIIPYVDPESQPDLTYEYSDANNTVNITCQTIAERNFEKGTVENILRTKPSPRTAAKYVKTSFEAFQLFFSDEMVENFTKFTNAVIETAIGRFSAVLAKSNKYTYLRVVDSDGIRAYIGIMYLRAAFRVNLFNRSSIWNHESAHDIFSATMSEKRFEFITQRTQTSLRRLQDVLKRSRRLATKQDVVTTSGKRRRIYDVLKTSDLRHLEDVQFRTS